MRIGRRALWMLLAVGIAAFDYGWAVGYYGGLRAAGALLSASRATVDSLTALLGQHALCNVPVMLCTALAALLLRGNFAGRLGLALPNRRARAVVLCGAGAYVVLLLVALALGETSAVAAAYQWFYYLVWVALAEELIFRSILPECLRAGGLPEAVVWLLPGVLFALAHTAMAVVEGAPAAELLMQALSQLGGYTVMSCILYELRRWSGTLWLPVLVHAALDFLWTIV